MKKELIRPTSLGRFPEVEGWFDLALGNGTQIEVFTHWVGECHPDKKGTTLFIGVIGKGCYTFERPNHGSYVGEKLRLEYADALNLADFISCQFTCCHTVQGSYMVSLCSDFSGRNLTRKG